MAQSSVTEWDSVAIMDGGERVTHLYPNDCYYAHLSIYHFALQFCRDAVVLDAGSGAGYGAAYLAEHGALFVHGVDVSAKAVAFSQASFQRPNLDYQARDLSVNLDFERDTFDLVFSSNVLEHVPDVCTFLQQVVSAMKPGATMVLAVPPILNIVAQADNLSNLYHLNIWSPRQWHHILSKYFGTIAYYEHHPRPGLLPDFANLPEETTISEDDFEFIECPLAMIDRAPTMTAVFLLGKPHRDPPPAADALTFIDQSYTLAPDDLLQRKNRADMLLDWVGQIKGYLAGFDQAPPAEVQDERADLNDGVTALVQDLHRQLKDSEQRASVYEKELQRKNTHILQLESLLCRLENGRLMRLLRRFAR